MTDNTSVIVLLAMMIIINPLVLDRRFLGLCQAGDNCCQITRCLLLGCFRHLVILFSVVAFGRFCLLFSIALSRFSDRLIVPIGRAYILVRRDRGICCEKVRPSESSCTATKLLNERVNIIVTNLATPTINSKQQAANKNNNKDTGGREGLRWKMKNEISNI